MTPRQKWYRIRAYVRAQINEENAPSRTDAAAAHDFALSRCPDAVRAAVRMIGPQT